jgi:pimeloyl-ACP methyl ester carboxylesterase
MRILTAMLLCFVSILIHPSVLANADYAREKKWADEITPGIVVGDPVYLQLQQGHRFLTLLTETKDAKAALILLHGAGVHPDWGLIGVLRTQLADHGFTTLSLQLPVLPIEVRGSEYRKTYPEGVKRIATAVDFLQKKGYSKIAIVSHSLGSDVGGLYIRQQPSKLFAWASLGIEGDDAFSGIKIPVLDLYGENDLPGVVKSAPARAASLKGNPPSKQVMLVKSDHFYSQHEKEMVDTVKAFLLAAQ